jgi:hypothetical protein
VNVNPIPEWPATEQTEWILFPGRHYEETGRTYPAFYVTKILTRVGEQLFQCAVSMGVDEWVLPAERRAEIMARKMECAEVALRDVVQHHMKSLDHD